jgi:hypothetical protein
MRIVQLRHDAGDLLAHVRKDVEVAVTGVDLITYRDALKGLKLTLKSDAGACHLAVR